jgi:catechol 2,3-dioxygenase-like lactoylglutathione lyase family enzyme
VGRSKHGFASERSVWRCLLRIGQAVANILHCLSHRKIAHGFPEETMQQDDGFSVYVRDPDGNKIELYGKRTEV